MREEKPTVELDTSSVKFWGGSEGRSEKVLATTSEVLEPTPLALTAATRKLYLPARRGIEHFT